MNKNKQLSKSEMNQMAKKATMGVLSSIVPYAEILTRLKNLIDDEETPPAVKVAGMGKILDQYQNLMNFEVKNPGKNKKDTSGLSDDELDLLLEQAQEDGLCESSIHEAEIVQ